MTKLLQQCFLFFIVVVIPGHNLVNSQVSVNRTIGPTLVLFQDCIIWFNPHVSRMQKKCTATETLIYLSEAVLVLTQMCIPLKALLQKQLRAYIL